MLEMPQKKEMSSRGLAQWMMLVAYNEGCPGSIPAASKWVFLLRGDIRSLARKLRGPAPSSNYNNGWRS